MKYNSIFLFFALIIGNCTTPTVLESGEGFVEVNGGKIWYRIIGEGNKAPILTMHGGPGGNHRYFYQLEELSKDRPIILFDQLGTGRSGYHTDTALLTVQQFVDQVFKLKEAIGLKEYYLLGHSWGAALELEYFLQHPEGVKGIVFSSPYVSTPLWAADAAMWIKTLPDSVQLAIGRAEITGSFNTPKYQEADSIYWSKFGLRTEKKRNPIDSVDAPSNRFIYNYMWGPSEFTATGILKDYDNAEGLKKVNVPTLFMTGEFDEARPETVQYLSTLVPGSTFKVIANAGHSTLYDNKAQYIEGLSQFLGRVENR